MKFTCMSRQHWLWLEDEDLRQVMGRVDLILIGAGCPPSLITSCEGVMTFMPRKNGELSSSFVLLPMISCLTKAEHCTWKKYNSQMIKCVRCSKISSNIKYKIDLMKTNDI